jgi:hypothetical protein
LDKLDKNLISVEIFLKKQDRAMTVSNFLVILVLAFIIGAKSMKVPVVMNTQGLSFFFPEICQQWILPNPSCMCVPYEELDFPWIYQHQVPYMFLGSFRPDLNKISFALREKTRGIFLK